MSLVSIISGEDRSVCGGVARLALAGLEQPYRVAVSIRNQMYNRGLRSVRRLDRPTISVGNITAGGTGKTPMVIELVRRLIEIDVHPAVLLRGYGSQAGQGLGGESGSDESVLIAEELGEGVPIGVGADRCAAAAGVLEDKPGVGAFVLDDGFQRRGVHRDVDLVLIDAMEPFGYGHVLPRGFLREPISGLRRADGVIITRADRVSSEGLAELDRRIERVTGRRPVAHAAYRWESFIDLQGGDFPLDRLAGERVVGVCGVGNPGAFEGMLRGCVGGVVDFHAMSDHHRYERRMVESLVKSAAEQGAGAVVITHKDSVKWRGFGEGLALPVYYPRLSVGFLDGGEAVDALVRGAIGR